MHRLLFIISLKEKQFNLHFSVLVSHIATVMSQQPYIYGMQFSDKINELHLGTPMYLILTVSYIKLSA